VGRSLELAPELAKHNVRTNDQGIEIAQLHSNGDYELNYLECYKEIVRWSFDPARLPTLGVLNREFGIRGQRGYDPTVNLMVLDMVALGCLELNPTRKTVKPLMGIARARKVLPGYTSLRLTVAGLHPLGEDE
jgi:hypothetical protein